MCLLQDPCVAHVISRLEVTKGFCTVYRWPAAWLSSVHRITACKQMLMQQDAQIGCYTLSLCRTLSPFFQERFLTSLMLTTHPSSPFCRAHYKSTPIAVLRSTTQ